MSKGAGKVFLCVTIKNKNTIMNVEGNGDFAVDMLYISNMQRILVQISRSL